MSGLDGKLLSGQLEGHKTLKVIPLVLRYTAGVPAVLQNPCNEDVTIGDTGTGQVSITLASAALAPLVVAGLAVRASVPLTLGNIVHLGAAPTSSVVTLVVQDASDGATEVDPVDIHVTLLKLIQG